MGERWNVLPAKPHDVVGIAQVLLDGLQGTTEICREECLSKRHVAARKRTSRDFRVVPRATKVRRSKLPSYSISSSASASNLSGTWRPSDLADLRLMTISNLVGSCTGKSAGFSPRRMRSVYFAALRNTSA
jgi:hypothetical protein